MDYGLAPLKHIHIEDERTKGRTRRHEATQNQTTDDNRP